MKNNSFAHIITLSLLAAAFSACQKDVDPTTLPHIMKQMSFSTGISTKTYMATPGVAIGSTSKIYWEQDDPVAIWDGTAAESFLATPDASEPENAVVSGSAYQDVDTYYAIYPYDSFQSFDDATKTMHFSIPSVQTVRTDRQSYDRYANVSIARSNDDEVLTFRNVGPRIRIKLSDSSISNVSEIDLVTIIANPDAAGNRIALTGNFTADASSAAPSATPVSGDITDYAQLKGSFVAGNYYYIPIAPADLASGVTISFVDFDNQKAYTVENTKSVSLDRNAVYSLEFTPALKSAYATPEKGPAADPWDSMSLISSVTWNDDYIAVVYDGGRWLALDPSSLFSNQYDVVDVSAYYSESEGFVFTKKALADQLKIHIQGTTSKILGFRRYESLTLTTSSESLSASSSWRTSTDSHKCYFTLSSPTRYLIYDPSTQKFVKSTSSSVSADNYFSIYKVSISD